MLRALLWDHDGVLVDTEALYFRATRETLHDVGIALSHEDYRKLFLVAGKGAFHLARERGFDEAAVRELRRARDLRYLALLEGESVVIPGAPEAVERLGRCFRMAIVTSSLREPFDCIHRTSGLLPHFELVLTREAYAHSKPDPEPYLTALKRLGLSAEECLVIEDSERGLRAAAAAGVRCWVVPSALTAGSSFRDAERCFTSLSALEGALLSEHRLQTQAPERP